MTKVVLASSNAGKLRELADLFRNTRIEIISQKNLGVVDAEETGLSFIENAILKARNASRQTGLAAIADDSGLCVAALNGEPGIYSSRYAGRAGKGEGDDANNRFLLEKMIDIKQKNRGAEFYCAMAYVRHADDPAPLIAQGIWQGRILDEPRGDRGFGYDPLFWVEEENCSSAELEKSHKNRISHRAKALQKLITEMQAVYGIV